MTLVYIEDDLDDIERFYEAVKAINPTFHCYGACDGLKGLALLDEIDPPDFIFVDVNMPGLTGKEILMMLRRDSRFKTTPIVITSILLTPADAKDLRLCGASYCMKKPDHLEELVEKISAIIQSNFVVDK